MWNDKVHKGIQQTGNINSARFQNDNFLEWQLHILIMMYGY